MKITNEHNLVFTAVLALVMIIVIFVLVRSAHEDREKIFMLEKKLEKTEESVKRLEVESHSAQKSYHKPAVIEMPEQHKPPPPPPTKIIHENLIDIDEEEYNFDFDTDKLAQYI